MKHLRRQIRNWKAVMLGTSGNFRIGDGLAVEFIQTALDSVLLSKVDPVRRVFKRDELRFDMLLQRDLDDDRINEDLIPYLGESHRLRFFPAITVVVIPKPTRRKSGSADLPDKYPTMEQKIVTDENGSSQWVRIFGGVFEVARFISDPAIKTIEELTEDCLYPEAELRLTDEACLLAIDGQHRLVALQGVMDTLVDGERLRYPNLNSIDHASYSNLKVPATIMYIPNLHAGDGLSDLTLAVAFRQVFVDINRNARQVNESRNILLDEHDLNSIFTRTVCSFVQDRARASSNEEINLDCIEWDKVDQENQLTRPASITNVVFIKSVFQSWLGDGSQGDDGGMLRANLQLDLLQPELESSEVSYRNLSATTFTYAQKTTVMRHFEKAYLGPFVDLLSSIPGALKRQKIVGEVRNVLAKTDGSPEDIITRVKVLEVLFGGPEHADNLRDKKVKALYRLQTDKLSAFDISHGVSIVRTKMFQRAFFQCVLEIYAARYVRRMEFQVFCDTLVPHLRGRFQTQWFKLFGKERPALDKYGLDRYGVAEWKMQFVFDIVFLLLVKADSDFVIDSAGCVLKRQEYSARLWKSYQERVGTLVQEDRIRGSEEKKVIAQGEKEIRALAGKEFIV